MAKLTLRTFRKRGWWAVALAAVVSSWGLLGSVGSAQTPAGKAKPAAQAKKAPKPAKSKPAKKTATVKNNKAAAATLPPKEKIAPVTAGLRDPFKMPEPPPTNAGGRIDNEPRPPGPRGLAVSEMILQGIVREDVSNTMIAVVVGPERRAYFLRLNDQVYHASVSKITPDAVYFTETFTDPAGHEATREAVKKLPATGEKP